MSDLKSNATTKPPDASARRRRRRRSQRWVVVGVLIAMAAALAIAGRGGLLQQDEQRAENGGQGAESKEPSVRAPHTSLPVSNAEPLIDDDGTTLWASPTDSPPLDLSCLPPGPQIVLALRPAALAAHPEGEKVVAALGPFAVRGPKTIEERIGLPLREIDRLIIGWRVTLDGEWGATLVATAESSRSFRDQSRRGSEQSHAGRTYCTEGELAYFVPAGRNSSVLVVAAPETIREIIELDGHAPPLRRGLEQMRKYSDASRHVTLMCVPNSLFSEGRGMFVGSMARLRDPLFWFFGDRTQAAALSLHWDDDFFVELLAAPSLDVSTDQLARELSGQVDELPDRVEDYVLSLTPQPYGRRVVARLPEMVRKLAAYTRHGFDRDHAVLRAYLPAAAGHNLLMGTELTLAESPAVVGPRSGPTAEAVSPTTIRDRLQRRTSLRFARETLEAALKMLADDVDVEITIRGSDLQQEGITRNQQLGIDMTDQPAGQLLVEILRRANPDKSATGPADPRQKLVYVISPAAAEGHETIMITTRSRAAEWGEQLPVVFVETPR
jgi:hypothetical protein